jgi:hypothetical protein
MTCQGNLSDITKESCGILASAEVNIANVMLRIDLSPTEHNDFIKFGPTQG